MVNLVTKAHLLERQSDSVAERLDQLPWQQLLLWQVGDRISWSHMMPGEDCEPGTFQLSSLHRNIGMIADGWRTQRPVNKRNFPFTLDTTVVHQRPDAREQ